MLVAQNAEITWKIVHEVSVGSDLVIAAMYWWCRPHLAVGLRDEYMVVVGLAICEQHDDNIIDVGLS